MGFLLAGNALLVLFLLLLMLRKVYGDDWEGLYEVGAGWGMGRGVWCGVGARATGSAHELPRSLPASVDPQPARLPARPPPTPPRPSPATVWAAPPSRCLAAWAAASTPRCVWGGGSGGSVLVWGSGVEAVEGVKWSAVEEGLLEVLA